MENCIFWRSCRPNLRHLPAMAKAMLHVLTLPILTFLTSSLANPFPPHLPTLARFLPPLNTPLPFPDLRCFPADAPYNLHTIDPADCRHLAHDIATLDVPRGKRWIFGTPDIPGVELTIPVTYSRKTCIAHIIDMESTQSAGDAFTMRYLSQKVARLAELCVKPGPHLGGEGRIGEKGMLALVLVGSDPPPPRGAGAGLGVVTAMGLNRTLDGVGIGGVVARGGGEGVVFEGGTGLL